MTTTAPSLMSIYEGWDSHQLALVRAITLLTLEQLSLADPAWEKEGFL